MASKLASALGRDPQASIQPYPRQPMARIPEYNMQRPPQQQPERLSPGVYRGANGDLVNAQGQAYPQQPQRPPMNMNNNMQQAMQGMQPQPNPFARDQFPQMGFAPNMMQQGFNQLQGQNVNIGKGMTMPIPYPQYNFQPPGNPNDPRWLSR